MEYLPRLADKALDSKLQYAGAVCIRGPKWCGKTSTAEQRAHSAIYLQDPDELENHLMLAQTKPSLLLQGDKPRLRPSWRCLHLADMPSDAPTVSPLSPSHAFVTSLLNTAMEGYPNANRLSY